jgi:hypothetical protein
MNYRFGLPWYGWLLLFLAVVFGPYVSKTIFANLYTSATGKKVPDSYYTTNIYGHPSKRYQIGKDIIEGK